IILGWRVLSRFGSVPLVLDAIQFGSGADEQTFARDCGCGHAHFAQAVFADEPVIGASLDHEGVALFAQTKYLAIVRPGRSRKAGRAFSVDALFAVNFPAGLRIVAAQGTEIEEDIEMVIVNQG